VHFEFLVLQVVLLVAHLISDCFDFFVLLLSFLFELVQLLTLFLEGVQHLLLLVSKCSQAVHDHCHFRIFILLRVFVFVHDLTLNRIFFLLRLDLAFGFSVFLFDFPQLSVALLLLGLLLPLAPLGFEEAVLEFVHLVLLLEVDIAGTLPLFLHLVAVLVGPPELLSDAVQFNLCGLGLRDFLVDFHLLAVVLHGQLLNGE